MLVYFALLAQAFTAGAVLDADSRAFSDAIHYEKRMSDDMIHKMQKKHSTNEGNTRYLRDQVKVDDMRMDFFLDDQCTMPAESLQIHGQYCLSGATNPYKFGCQMVGSEIHSVFFGFPAGSDCSGSPEYTHGPFPFTDDMDNVVMAGACVRYDKNWMRIRCERKDHLQHEDGMHFLNFDDSESCKPKSHKTHSHGSMHSLYRPGHCISTGVHKSISILGCDEHGAKYTLFKTSNRCEGEHGPEKYYKFPEPCSLADDDDHDDAEGPGYDKYMCHMSGMKPNDSN